MLSNLPSVFQMLGLGLFLLAGTASAANLGIQEMALTDGETSWRTPTAWHPGQQVFVRLIVKGLKRDAQGRIQVRESLELRDPEGRQLLQSPDLLRLERPVPDGLTSVELVTHFLVPEGLSAGAYRAWIRCTDNVTGTSVDRELEFSVTDGPQGGLRITDFTLAASADAAAATSGTTAQAEARLAGYRLDPEGQYWIEADVVLVDPSGKLALRWDKILEKREKSEPRGLPLKLSVQLELPEHYSAGDYRLELKVRDRLAQLEAVQSATWTKR